MKIVIDIPNKYISKYKPIQQWIDDADKNHECHITILPKGHGRLIDISDIEWAKFKRASIKYEYVECIDWEDIENAPTIIEADKKGEGKDEVSN